jgi:GntR family transcriptional regulator, transcriptional repressor for pyruvate dehydrogenase complex
VEGVASPFELQASPRRADQVVSKIREMVLSGALKPGDQLPSEMVLSEDMGVSRTALREGMRILEAQGVLETRPGVGTVVLAAGLTQLVKPLKWLALARYGGFSFDEFHGVRSILETEIAALAARGATDDAITSLEGALDDMDSALGDNRLFARHDARFHHVLAEMTGNRLLELLASAMRELLEDHIETVVAHIDPRADVMPYHAAILEAVRARDPVAARRAMQAHLDQVHTNFQAAMAAHGDQRAGGAR